MKKSKQNAESMLFNYETTYRSDFRNGKIREYPKTVYKARPSHYRRGTPAYKNIHTLSDWKGDMPSFSMLHKPKDVVKTNPNDVQQHYDKVIDIHREEAQRTRPRLVMTPAVSMDDITDVGARNLLINDMYMSDTTRTLKDAVVSIKYNNAKAPLPGRPAPSNPIFLPKLEPPLVSPEWRMDSVTWDQRQLRAHCDPTRTFWLTQELPKCKMCDETTAVRAHRKMLMDLKRTNR